MNKVDKYIEGLNDIKDKKVIITGANSGIGFEASDILLSKGCVLIMACRNFERASKSREKLLEKHPAANIEIFLYDQSSLFDVKCFVINILARYPDFYALILNAGVFHPDKDLRTRCGLPLTSGINFFSHLLLTELLIERLKDTKDEKRIIFQGSLASRLSKNCKKVNFAKAYLNGNINLTRQYNLSKYALTNVFNYYANHNDNPHIKFLMAEPGITKSNIIRNFPEWFKFIANGFMSIFFHSTRSGALPCCFLVTSKVANGDYLVPKSLNQIRGLPKYYHLKKKRMSDEVVFLGLMEIYDRSDFFN